MVSSKFTHSLSVLPYRKKTNPVNVASCSGFTLLELMVIIAITGIILAVAIPRIYLFEDINIRRDARHTAGLIRYLNEASITKKLYYRLWFNLDKEEIRVESGSDGIEYRDETDVMLRSINLKDNVEIDDIVLPGLGRVNKGEVTVIFSPFGPSEPFNIHLKSRKKILTLLFNPYTGKVKVLDGYV